MTINNTRALNGNKSYGGTGDGALYAAITGDAHATNLKWSDEMQGDVILSQPKWHNGMEDEFIVSQLGMRDDQNRLVDDILEIFDDVVNNRDTDNGELGFAERIASRINDMMKSAGLTSFAQAAIMIVAERESKTKNKDLWSEVSEQLSESEKREARDNRIQNLWQDIDERVEQTRKELAEQQRKEREVEILRYAENDTTPSSEYPGMTVGEVLRGLRIINENLPFYSQRAVDRGLIKPEERLAFEQYMREKYWLEQQLALQRRGEPNALDTPEGRARARAIKDTEDQNPRFVNARREAMDATRRHGMTANEDLTIANVATRRNLLAGVMNAEDSTPLPLQSSTNSDAQNLRASSTPISVAASSENNGNRRNVEKITNSFNLESSGFRDAKPTTTGASIDTDCNVLVSRGASLSAGMV